MREKNGQPRFVTGSVAGGDGSIPRVSTRLSARDVLGGWRVRWNIGRMRYIVEPGLYAVGSPTTESPVLVTANYKLTFDKLRKELTDIDAWILVLDTRGINVWCAAGKGTFGTREVQERVRAVHLDRVVAHRTLILPQLGAPGVAAHEVREATGFNVKYGPVRARDIPAYLAAGQKKDDEMREVRFRLGDRMAIAPMELVQAWPMLLATLAGSALLALPPHDGYAARFLGTLVPLLGAVAMGTLVFPALLPLLPFRAFSLKGVVLGVLWTAVSAWVLQPSPAGAAALLLVITPIVAFTAMNFTGSSTFTCQPGAAREVRLGAIPMAASFVIGAGLLIAVRIFTL
jgi:hypothetical protein